MIVFITLKKKLSWRKNCRKKEHNDDREKENVY